MLHQKTVHTAQNFVESLREAVERGHSEASAILQEERRLASRGVNDDRKHVLHAWEKDLTDLQGNVAILTQLSDSVPSTSRVLECAVSGLDSIDEVLDRFERRLQADFGLPIIHISPDTIPTTTTTTPHLSSLSLMQHVVSTAPPPPSYANIATPTSNRATAQTSHITPSASTRKTPKMSPFRTHPAVSGPFASNAVAGASLRRNDTDVIPKTPRMEDFGLDADVLRALEQGNNEYLGGLPLSLQTEQQSCDIDISSWDGNNFKAGVQDSMRKIGIDLSHAHLTDEFDHRRHIAMRNVLATSTPKLKTNISTSSDYSQLAAGYSSGNARNLSSRGPNRELSFDDVEE